jgi:hypothetical protein
MTVSDIEAAKRYLERHEDPTVPQLAGGIGVSKDIARKLLSELRDTPSNFPYEDLYYLRARGPDDKRPAESWGGYGQNFETATGVYRHDAVEMHPSSDWLLNAWAGDEPMPHQLLVFDLDTHKAPESFDGDRIGVPKDTALVKTQNGGLHVYTLVNSTTTAKESDFELTQDIPFGIDIRGEFVKHHVVAPSDVPGVENGYTLVQDKDIKMMRDAEAAARSITLDGSPLLKFNRSANGRSGGYEREDVDPPESMPDCYGSALTLRHEAPEDPELNTHKVNLLAALCGLAHGYDIDTVVGHFIDDYYPGDPGCADKERTRYQVEHIAEKLDNGDYSPPKVLTLQEYGILPSDEWCHCGLPGHTEAAEHRSIYYDHDLQALAAANGVEGDPYDDNRALLLTCLHVRDELGLEDAKPPYSALVEIAERETLPFLDYKERILGERTYETARQIFKNAPPSEFDRDGDDGDDIEEFFTELELSG